MIRLKAEEIPNFNVQFVCVGAILVVEKNILLLERAFDKPYGGTWCTPGGTMNVDEHKEGGALVAIQREFHEEVGYKLWLGCFNPLHTYFVRYEGDCDFVYQTFLVEMPDFPYVKRSESEHIGHAWVKPEEALKFNLIPDEDFVIKHTFNLL